MKRLMVLVTAALATGVVCAGVLDKSEWISVVGAPEYDRKTSHLAAPGTSWFSRSFTNTNDILWARWTVSGLGVFDVYVNGTRIGNHFLKPGRTHNRKTKYAFTYDVTKQLKTKKGETNVLCAEVSAGWWRDAIVSYEGCRSAFRGELEICYADKTREIIATKPGEWVGGVAGPVLRAGIYDGEIYDARKPWPTDGKSLTGKTDRNIEFNGEILLSPGAEVVLRRDRAMTRGPYALKKGETLVVDFGQNCAAVPEFKFKAKRGTTLTALPGEMLNDADKGQRGCDGPTGSVYRANLRTGNVCMRLDYTFSGEGVETYHPRFTYYGYRYLSITATDDVEIESVTSIPVTSVTPGMETGNLVVGDKSLARLIKNIYWSQLSNYLSVPTDCPQRNERWGWTGDTQIFCEAGSYNADTRRFFHKHMRDLRDSTGTSGGFPWIAPGGPQFNFGWSDAGVVVPWTLWKHYGDTRIVTENWDAMAKFVRAIDEKKYNFEDKEPIIFADWLSCDKYESFGNWGGWKNNPDAKNFRLYLAACHWLSNARMMAEMGEAIGKTEEAAWFRASEKRAREHIRATYLEKDGLLLKPMRDMQTACAFALKFDIVEGAARQATKEILLKSIRDFGMRLKTGFLGTPCLMEVLAKENEFDVAYSLLFQHQNPSWLYSVDQGATTIWERWDSYTKKNGFGAAGMNSFNHYAYGSVLAWIYRHAAGIACDSSAPGFKTIIMAPKPDRRLGFVRAHYASAAGYIKSAWRYDCDTWVWDFTVPKGTVARVTLPGSTETKIYQPGTYHEEVHLPKPMANRTREERVELFAERVYGKRIVERPPHLEFSEVSPEVEMLDGTAIRRQVRITYGGAYKTNSFVVTAFLPKARPSAPAFVLICNRFAATYADPTRKNKHEFWPVEEILKRGYAAIAFFTDEIAPDHNTGNRRGVFTCFEDQKVPRPANAWGTISAWAWGASRVMDWIETEPRIDRTKVAIVGHSRGGKTSLWTAVTDTRFAYACVNNSGCAGARLHRRTADGAETIERIYKVFPYWFCANFAQCAGRDHELDFDQDELLTCVAPRLLAVGSAEADGWACPPGERLATERARPAWQDPTRVLYHIRPGKHNLTLVDWKAYLDHAKANGW